MAPQAMTEYERRRLENVRRNAEIVASLKRRADDLCASVKAAKAAKAKAPSRRPTGATEQAPVVLRRSLRVRGVPPDPSRHPSETPTSISPPASPAKAKRPIRMDEVFVGASPLDRHLVGAISGMAENATLHPRNKGGGGGGVSWIPASEMTLVPENVKRLLPARILSVLFFPFEGRTIVAAGDKLGHLGFWDADFRGSEGDGTYVYAPHSCPISGISIQPFSPSKILTCSYDGFIRLMDVEVETFNMLYSSDYPIYSISQPPNDAKSIYFGEGSGELKVWDERAGKVTRTWVLHDQRINTIDFNTVNSNLMATSSSDGVACIWDLRKINVKKPERVKMVQHRRAIHSAYFSPNGSSLATTGFAQSTSTLDLPFRQACRPAKPGVHLPVFVQTWTKTTATADSHRPRLPLSPSAAATGPSSPTARIDDRVGIISGPDFCSVTMINHSNQTGRWLSSFRAIWGWDDTYLFMGNMKRAVDIISTVDKTTSSLESLLMTAIPCRFAAHPYKVGLLAGATAGGQVYMWKRSQRK